ncbi:MocR-like pyridoxine biosynthesis transcription factor PdxR [Bacillus sp. FJAT-42315]|uniref:MocR-like pyridoxine biosynthesis transcription factor PdxR n=1 Tax=Bacillus sp. FJAT-42315 TaxID=2014077 RepID=UPI000C235122|nr:PLP-dependent aminotransferase family protein [Bacillus sp. FJAT-42315]
MKHYLFSFSGNEPKYKQIYQQIKRLIEKQHVKADESLPSIRTLAEWLHVSRNTTLTAYEQLVAEGYIRGEGRRGYFVNPFEPIFLNEQLPKRKKEQGACSTVQIDFRAGGVDMEHFPLKKWRQLMNQTLQQKPSYMYGEFTGEMELREQLASYLLQSRGIEVTASEIIIGSSTQQLLLSIGLLLKSTHTHIILEDPGYNGAVDVFRMLQYEIETMSVTPTGHQFQQLNCYESKLMYVTPSHQFPYGVSLSIQQRQCLIQWAIKRQGFIIEDDYDSEFRYEQQPFPALSALDRSHVIYIGNFSKSFLPSLRIAYMIVPPTLQASFQATVGQFENNASLLHQQAMATFMKEGEWVRHIKRMRNVYKQKMHLLVSELQQAFGNEISIIGEKSGLYVVAQLHTNETEASLIQKALAYGVKVYPTTPYFIEAKTKEPLIQLGFSSLTFDEIVGGVQLLKKAWEVE